MSCKMGWVAGVILCLLSCSTVDKTEIKRIMEQFREQGFKVTLDKAAKSSKAGSLMKSREDKKTKLIYKLTLTKDDITKKITIYDFQREELQRNLYNLRNAVSNGNNNYFVLNNDTLVMTLFSFDYAGEKAFVDAARKAFLSYKRQ